MRFPVTRTGLLNAKVAIVLVATAGLMAGAEVLAGEPPPGGAGSAAMQEGPGRPRIVPENIGAELRARAGQILDAAPAAIALLEQSIKIGRLRQHQRREELQPRAALSGC